MEIKKVEITIADLCKGYENETEIDIEKGVYAYGGKLCVRPAFQRSFVYNKKQENAVIDTALKGFPLNIMYWVDNGDGTYDCLDGQQRTISLCNFVAGSSSFHAPWLTGKDPKKVAYVHTLKRLNEELYNKFMNYKLEIYICKGTKAEQMEWFHTINIAGEELSNQELRNANYVSRWLTDAKRYFSKANPNSTAKCPAEVVGKKYTKANANRQELLEQVISWKINSKEDADICNYMEEHINDEDASDLWNYFNNVIDWVKELFPGSYDDAMKSMNWGKFYNEYHNKEYDPNEIIKKIEELTQLKAEKILDVGFAKIYEYCITRDEKLLSLRAFNDAEKRTLYKKQNGCCADCGEHFDLSKLEAHHIKAWNQGGKTELSNGVLICKKCHNARHNY